ncbi:MAG TPA: oligosaccharide flippase family protein [Longimicrobiales bacterium]|nr:oligosaccharide flippase family protein [Longimicrobiales bacterium]
MTVTATPPPSAAGVRQVLANGVALLLAYVVPRVFMVASVVLAARLLGPRDFGVYGTAAAWAVMLSAASTLGMHPLLVREIARQPERAGALVAAAHAVKTGTNAVMLLAALALAWVVPTADARVHAAVLVLAVGYALGAYAENLGAYYQAVERMDRWTRASALFGVVSAAVGAGLLIATGSLVAFCWGQAAGWAAALAWLRLDVPPGLRGGGSPRRADVAGLLRALVPFGLAFVAITIYSKVDVLLLAALKDDVTVGVYTASYKFVDVFQALVIVAAGAVYPRLARTAAPGGPARWRGGRSVELILLAAVPAGLTLHLLAAPLTRAVFSEAYAASVPPLRLLALVLPILALTVYGGYVLGAARRMLPVAGLYAAGIALNVTLNLLLVPGMGARGAAAARLASEAALAVGMLVVLDRVAGAGPGNRALALAGGAALVGLAAASVPDPTGGWMRAAVAAAAWTALYAAGRALAPEEVLALRRGLGRKG